MPPDFDELAKVSARLRLRFDKSSRPGIDTLVDYLLSESLLNPVFEGSAIKGPLLDSPTMEATPGSLVTFPLPELSTWSDVAAWLSLSDKELAWFSDGRSQQSKVTERKLHHYSYYWVPKRSGSLRLIEAPKSRLKEIQRKVLNEILNRVPPHPCAHGFSRGRSTRSYAAPHTGQEAVLRLDLKDFFHSVPVARVGALFRRVGYPTNVAWLLQGLCTTSASPALAGKPFEALSWDVRKRLESKHLAQGAPTSAQLANLCAWRLDCRLDGLAKRFGLQYTRYADDMAFSGPYRLARMSGFLEALAGSIAIDEGFRLNHRKTRLRLASQRQCLAGVVVNEKPNCRRADWDRLKAILHNCGKHGPESQNVEGHPNFRAHLRGRVAYISWLSPSRGQKLQRLWDKIDWNS
ncbi:MAG: reverse transcriptase family protein [Woeseiaceae bacterium]|nr:reverse transcriptase family protein [Woeseiaceae bacterium]